ncbi:MAG TPA: molybdopterin-dependent oxidoreductase [Puia sp.]|nr:molybdopterin-dependent oxidoreductase [Puia sp.]
MKKTTRHLFANYSKTSVEYKAAKKTLISFTIFITLAIVAVFSWRWLWNQPFDNGIQGGIQKPFRSILNLNEKVFGNLESAGHLAKTYPVSEAAKRVRVNGNIGLGNNFDATKWKLQVVKSSGDTAYFTIEDLKRLPKTEIIFNFKCIEGWNQITWWGGVRFADFIKFYHLENESSMKYVGMTTPGNEYYVGIDMPSALHPQTLLCYEMNRQPLPMNQGFPLRLIIPVKYGIKSIKRIGTIFFSNEKPPDYWFERGYDYYAGL